MTPRESAPSEPRDAYRTRLQARRESLGHTENIHARWGLVRLALVAAGAVAGWYWLQGALPGAALLVAVAAFIGVGQLMATHERRRERIARAIRLYERGLERLDDRWNGVGPTGLRFLDDDHPYARDLDLFGDESIYQLLCAARTAFGRERLADWLLGAAPPDDVRKRQRAVEELAPALDFREALSVTGDDVGTSVHPGRLADWGESEPALALSSLARTVVRVGALAGIGAVLGLLAHLAAQFQFLELSAETLIAIRLYAAATFVVLLASTWPLRKTTARVLEGIEEAAQELELLASLLRLLEQSSFGAPLLREMRAALGGTGSEPSRRIARLGRLMQLFDSRRNLLVRAIGPLVLWDLQLGLAIEDWRARSGEQLRGWIRTVADHEALASLARYRFERPETVFPELTGGEAFFEAEALGHPLLPAERLVRNDVRLGDALRVWIVSGSNMSGKSTLLRTIGVATVLAQAGAPVRASSLRLSRLAVGASIRLQDSLREGTSRFYAEILRLRQIVEIAAGDVPALFLIDEFLHGTNSHDRRAGASAIVRGLVERGAIGLITTHDLALTDIAEALGDAGANVHFADELVEGRMHFDYRLREGVVDKSNAIELMRSIGLDV